MEKRRGFMLATLLLLLMLVLIQVPFIFGSGWQLAKSIVYLVKASGTVVLIYSSVGIAMSGLSLICLVVGGLASLFFLLISFLLFIVSSKKPKLAIPTYIVLGVTLLVVFSSYLTVLFFELGKSINDTVCYSIFIDHPFSIVLVGTMWSYAYRLPSYVAIVDVVKGGLGCAVSLLSSAIVVIPLITYILSLLVGRRKPKEAMTTEIIEIK